MENGKFSPYFVFQINKAAYINQEAEGSDDRRLRSNQRCVNSFDVVLTLAGRMLARTLSHIPELLTRAGHRTQG